MIKPTPAAEASTDLMTRPLRGIHVLDFSTMMAGPYGTRMLADLGAEVIKVEAPGGDTMRNSAPLRDGHSAYFAHLNAGKRSIVLDLKQPRDQAAALRLAEHVDVVVENYRPGVMQRLGLGYATLAAANAGLVYCSISGYGQHGPDAGRPAFAPMIHAASGLDLAVMGHQRASEPPASGIFTADVMAAMYAVIAIQAALAARSLTGLGQHLDVTLFESVLSLMPYEMQEAQFPAASPRPVYRPIRARDGFLMTVVITKGNFDALCRAIDRPDLKLDPRFASSTSRAANRVALMAEVETWTLQRAAQDCEVQLAEAGVPCARYRSVRDNLHHSSVAARSSLGEVHDGGGGTRVPHLPFLMAGQRPAVGAAVPPLGADTRDVLDQIAGMADAEIDALIAAQISAG